MSNILSYEEVLENLNNIIDNPNSINKINKQRPIGYSTFGYPISYYTFGSGENHIVIAAGTHGCEIITTDFIINLMKEISNGNRNFDFLKNNNYTLHFLPLLNPEGYIISTSAIKKIIKENMSEKEIQKTLNEYNERYETDDMNVILNLDRPVKEYQKMCDNIDYTCISNNHLKLRESVKTICENNDIPKGSLVTWSSNGVGVDLNQNSPYNPYLKLMQEGITGYSYLRYNNIKSTKPSPIGCPTRNTDGKFMLEPENKALQNFLFELKHFKNLCAYITYHSVGGELYYKPYQNTNINMEEIMTNLQIEEIYNSKIASLYSSKTNYQLINDIPTVNCANDLLRIQVNGDILIELCEKGKNGMGTYIEPERTQTIEKNLEACAFIFEKLPNLKKSKDEMLSKTHQEYINKNDDIITR